MQVEADQRRSAQERGRRRRGSVLDLESIRVQARRLDGLSFLESGQT